VLKAGGLMIKETGIVLNDVLEMDLMKNCKLIAGQDGVNNVITRVNIMADPDILNWVDEGEFLLTTAYFFKITSVEEQKKLIEESHRKKLSGIGIKIFPYLEKLPDEIVELANTLKFPIVELDYEIPFADIMTPIFKEIFNKQSLLLQKVENVHNDTMDVILKGGSIKEIIRVLSRTVENPIIVKDHHFEEYICDESSPDPHYDQLVDSVKKYFKTATHNYRSVKKLEDSVLINGEMMDRIMVPILVKNNVYGHIIIFGSQRQVSSFDVVSLESASTIIALEFLKKISVQEVENKYKAEFFEDLISFDDRRKRKAIERANYYRFRPEANYSILTVYVNRKESEIDNGDELNQYINKIIYLIDLGSKGEDRTYLIANKGSKINILFMWDDITNHAKDSRHIAENIAHLIEQKIGNIRFRIGVGRVYKGIEESYKSLHDAEKAVEASKSYVEEKIIEFEKLGIYKIFCQDHLKDELRSFFSSTLKPLVDYDRKRDTELVKSLEVYFQTNGNLKKMSEVLYTHYNTVLYRINRIQEITAKDLDCEYDRYGLQTALKIMHILDL